MTGAACYFATELFEKGVTGLSEPLFESLCAIASAACPWVLAVQVAAVFASVCVLNAEHFKIFFPIGTFLGEWCWAKANLYPTDHASLIDASVLHVLKIFVAGDRALSQRPFINGPHQSTCVPRFHACFNEVAHATGNVTLEKGTVTTGNPRQN